MFNLAMPHSDPDNDIDAPNHTDPNPSPIPHYPSDFFQHSFSSPQQLPHHANQDSNLPSAHLTDPHSQPYTTFLQHPNMDQIFPPPPQSQSQPHPIPSSSVHPPVCTPYQQPPHSKPTAIPASSQRQPSPRSGQPAHHHYMFSSIPHNIQPAPHAPHPPLFPLPDHAQFTQPSNMHLYNLNQMQNSLPLAPDALPPHNAANLRPTRDKNDHNISPTAKVRTKRFKKRAKRSIVWNYFTELEDDPNKARCVLCGAKVPRGRKLARNTTNLRKHLCHRHPHVKGSLTRDVASPHSFSPGDARHRAILVAAADSPSQSPSESDPTALSPGSTLVGSHGDEERQVPNPVPATESLPASAVHPNIPPERSLSDQHKSEHSNWADFFAASSPVSEKDAYCTFFPLLAFRNMLMHPPMLTNVTDLVSLKVPSSRKALSIWLQDNIEALQGRNSNTHAAFNESIRIVRSMIAGKLRTARNVVISVERQEQVFLIRCQYFDSSYEMQVVYLAVFPNAKEDTCGAQWVQSFEDDMVSELITRIYKELKIWQIREKAITVAVSTSIGLSQKLLWINGKGAGEGTMGVSSAGCTASVEDAQYNNRTRDPSTGAIPIVPCLVRPLEDIVNTMIGDKSVRRRYLVPMWSVLHRPFDEDGLRCSSDEAKKWEDTKKSAVHNILSSVQQYNTHLQTMQYVAKSCNDESSDGLNASHSDFKDLEKVLQIFSKAICDLSTPSQSQTNLRSKRLSFALPIVHSVQKELHMLTPNIAQSLVSPTVDAIVAVRNLYRSLEASPLATSATLLDPCFRGHVFTSAHVLESAKEAVLRACERELWNRRQTDAVKREYFMTNAMQMQDQLKDSADELEGWKQALGVYMMEPRLEAHADALQFWLGCKARWPTLASVAISHLLIPCSCEADKQITSGGFAAMAENYHELLFLRCNLMADDTFKQVQEVFDTLREDDKSMHDAA